MACGIRALVMIMGQIDDTWVVKPSNHVIRTIGRGVVDDNQLEIGKRLGQHALDGRAEVSHAVVGWNDDADFRSVHLNAPGLYNVRKLEFDSLEVPVPQHKDTDRNER